MLIDKYKGKNVKMLVSSNSGIGIARAGDNYGESMTSSIIVIIGNIKDFDDEYVELDDCQILRTNVHDRTNSSVFGIKDNNGYIPNVKLLESFSTSLISKKNIITISLFEE